MATQLLCLEGCEEITIAWTLPVIFMYLQQGQAWAVSEIHPQLAVGVSPRISGAQVHQ